MGQTHLQQSAGTPPPGKPHTNDWLNVTFVPPSLVGVSGGASAGDGDGGGAHISDCPHLPPSGSGLPGNKHSTLSELSQQPC